MELKTPPHCDCGTGVMILRKAGDHSTRPGHYYYVCPAGRKHRKSFYWYLEYHGRNVTPTEEQPYNSEHTSTNFEDHLSNTSTQTFCKKESMNSSSGPHVRPWEEGLPHDTKQDSEMDRGISRTRYELPNPGMKITPYSRDHVCCCFGFICALICVLFLLVVILLFKL